MAFRLKIITMHHPSSLLLAVVLNRNEFDLTVRCIASLKAQTVALDILVIDNDSLEDSSDALKKQFPEIISVRNHINRGVAGGRNTGIDFAVQNGYRYILFIDNDAFADRVMVAHLFDAAKRNPRAGILGPKILMDGAPQVIWRAGCTSWKWTYLHAGYILSKRIFSLADRPLPKLLDTVRGEDQPDAGQYDVEQDIDFQIGCAQLIRADVFEDVGLLDEEFTPYGSEDIDFCIRSKRSGWKIRYVPTACCWHRVGSSFQDEYQRTYFNTRHILLLARKHLHPVYFWLLYLPDFLCLTLPLMLAESILQKKKQRRKAIVDAIAWHLKDIRTRGILLGKRIRGGPSE
jgi:GT2 family glycosyltransferase